MEYTIDLSKIDKALTQDVNKIVQDMKIFFSQKPRYSDRIVFLHAWKAASNNTCCAFAEISKDEFVVFFGENGKNKFYPMIESKIDFRRFYLSFQKELCDEIMCGWLADECEKQEFDHIWRALLQLFPDYTVPTVKYEKYMPYDLDKLVGAEEYLNSGILFRMSESNNLSHVVRFKWEVLKVSNYGKLDEKRYTVNIQYRESGYQTVEEYENSIRNYSDRLLKKALLSIPHKIYYLDTPLSEVSRTMMSSYDCREIHIFESKTEMTYIFLNTDSIYFGHPMEGGTMGGSIFSKIMEVPAEEYEWTREQLIEKYEKYFIAKK